MNPMDQIFSNLPESTKKKLLSDASLQQFNRPAGDIFESAEAFNAFQVAPLEFLVEGLLARGHLVMLGGRSKSGKSWLVAQLAQALDSGGSFLGRAVQPARVLYLALEDKRSRLKRRSVQLGWTPQKAAFDYHIERFNGPAGEAGPGLRLIERVARDYDVILIDTLIATLNGNISENDNTQMAAIANELADIAHGMRCTILLVHHTNKGMSDDVFNLLRGASALRGAYDVGLLLERRQGEREAVLHIEARDFMAESLTIRQRENGSGWDVVGGAMAINQIRAGRNVLGALETLGADVSAKEIAEFLQLTPQAVGQQLRLAERDGRVMRKRSTFIGKGRPKELWSLATESGVTSRPDNENPPKEGGVHY